MQLNAFQIPDPRSPGATLGVVAFYYPGYREWHDKLCGCGFLGSFWDLLQYKDAAGKPLRMSLEAPARHGGARTFTNAEAAFQALKFWATDVEGFQTMSGTEASRRKTQLEGKEDFTYGGYGSNWAAMRAVLTSKFSHEPLRSLLLKTSDAFLLEHNTVTGRDDIWSDNYDGTGQNWLGLQLMWLRDEISGRNEWTRFFQDQCEIDMETGKAGNQLWQSLVQRASKIVIDPQSRSPPSQSEGDGIVSQLLRMIACAMPCAHERSKECVPPGRV